MEALGYQNYNGNWYVCGQEIPVESEEEAADMVALRLAKRKPLAPVLAEQPVPSQPPVHRDMTPAADVRSKKDKKRYKHREMRADES